MLLIVDTHPVQYRVQLYRKLVTKYNMPAMAFYAEKKGVEGYQDKEFGCDVKWDVPLLEGYDSLFLTNKNHLRIFCSFKWFKEIVGFTRANKVKAIFIPGYNHPVLMVAIFLALSQRIPIIYRAEATDHDKERGLVLAIVRDAVLKRLYSSCFKILYIGKRALVHYKRLGVKSDKLIFSPYCVDENVFHSSSSKDFDQFQRRFSMGLKLDSFILLYSGKISPRKNPGLILSACRLLDSEIRGKIEVVFLGTGELVAELKEKAKSLPDLSCHFLGFKNQTELKAYYEIVDALVMPSLYGETWGLVVNEALLSGIPCIVSDVVGCAPDLIEEGKTGYIFKNNDERDLKDIILKMYKMSDIDRAQMRKECLKKSSYYSSDHAVASIFKAYQEAFHEADS